MNTKSVFGIILTIIGLVGLIYAGIDFTKGGVAQASFVYLILGAFFSLPASVLFAAPKPDTR
ncbi:MAG TPA: hypothetical protein VK404_15170 [Spirosoma sp.]|nr:hypothetical protein [Spirosoma sp.]